jgi:optic atrophy 3 protein
MDIRLRLGLLQDSAAIERQVQREIAEAEARRARSALPTAKTEAQQKWDQDRLKKEIKQIEEKAKALPRVRPLSETKAIETGANFISETFLFCVAGGVIVFEYWRQRRKEANRRDEVADRMDALDNRIERIEHALIPPILETPKVIALPSGTRGQLQVDKNAGDTNTDKTTDLNREREGRLMIPSQKK